MRAEFFGAFPSADIMMLERGWCVAYHCLSDMYGCPEAVSGMHEFYKHMVSEYGLNPCPSVFGFSRGGLYASNYCFAHPDCLSSLYLDAPVMSIQSWPCGNDEYPKEKKECLACYGLTEETLVCFKDNPIDHSEQLGASGVPVILVAGGKDEVVPFEDNGLPFSERFRLAGGDIAVIVKPECGHHPHSLENARPIADFIEKAFHKHYL